MADGQRSVRILVLPLALYYINNVLLQLGPRKAAQQISFHRLALMAFKTIHLFEYLMKVFLKISEWRETKDNVHENSP